MTAIKKLKYMEKVHLEKRRGTPTEARNYCMKDDTRVPDQTPTEVGLWNEKQQGKRSDILVATEMLDSGASMMEVADALPATYVRMHKGLNSYQQLHPPASPANPPCVTLLFGPPGVGKTRMAREAHPFNELYVAPIGSSFKWYDGYSKEPAVLFDDFDGKLSAVPLSNVLPTIDRYVIRVPVKGSHVWFRPTTIYITSNFHPSQWYDWGARQTQYKALERRFTNIAFWPTTAVAGDPPTLLTHDSPLWRSFWDCLIPDLY